MAATSPVNSVWTGKTTRLCRLSSRRPGVLLSCQLVVASPLVVLSLRCPLVVLLRQLSHCLSPSSLCATLSSTRRASLLTHRLSLSSRCAPRRPLVLSLRWLVVALPLDTPLSCRLVFLSCRLLLSHRASWLSRHHLLPPSRPLIVLAGCCVACPCSALSS
jgi:hypothetical protein